MEIKSTFDKQVYIFNQDSEITVNLEFEQLEKIKKISVQQWFVFFNLLGSSFFRKWVQYHNSNEKLNIVTELSWDEIKQSLVLKLPIQFPLLALKYSWLIPYVKVTIYTWFFKKVVKKIKLNIQFDNWKNLPISNSNKIDDLQLIRNKKIYSIVGDLNQIIFKNKKSNYKKEIINLLDRVDALLIQTKSESEKRNLKEIYKFIEKIYSGKNVNDNISIYDLKRLLKDISLIEKQEQIDTILDESDNFLKLPVFNEFLSWEIQKQRVDYIWKNIYDLLTIKSLYFNIFMKLWTNSKYLNIHNKIASLIWDSRIFYFVMWIVVYFVVQFAYKINFSMYMIIILICFWFMIVISWFYYFNLFIQNKALSDIQNYFISLKFQNKHSIMSSLDKILLNWKVWDIFQSLQLKNLPINVKINVTIYFETVLRTWYLNKDTWRNESNDELIYTLPIFDKSIITENNYYNLVDDKLQVINWIDKLQLPIYKITKNKFFKQNKTSRIFCRFIININSDDLPDILFQKYIW